MSDGLLKKEYLKPLRKSYLTYSPSMFQIKVFSIFWKFSLEKNKIFSLKINSKPKNIVGWTKAFLNRLLSNKEVIGSTEVNLGDFLIPNIYYKVEIKVISTECFFI